MQSTPSRRSPSSVSRREFVRSTSSLAAVTAAGLAWSRAAHAEGREEIRVALVGCGGRGAGAAANVLSTSAPVKLVALADAFQDSLDTCHRALAAAHGPRVEITEDRKFVGLDAYQKAIASDVDLVLLCSPPGFRPAHFQAAVEAGKHVFMEKPVAVDAPGVRSVLAANEVAKKKNLAVAVGHHLRHEEKHRELIRRIHDGQLGEILFLRAYFNTGSLWVRPRRPDQTEMQYQVRNWYYFNWLSGDHIVEQHVHDLDVCNWIRQAQPVTAQGMGGRQVRIDKECGEIFDHHAVEFTYADGSKLFSYCRQIPHCWSSFSQHAHGTEGTAHMEGHGTTELLIRGQPPQRWKRTTPGHQVEQDDLLTAILAGNLYNEADYGAGSTMTAILGRMASYSGQLVTWEEALNSALELGPRTLDWDASPPAQPAADGYYACAIPGVTKGV